MELAIGAIYLLKNTRVEHGELQTPSGKPYIGFKVSVGEIQDQEEVHRTYEDIEAILRVHQVRYKETETRQNGHFKSFVIDTRGT